jgi:uncharacterized protein (TIGR03089 family)
MTNVGARFAAAVAVDPTRPLLTWYDDGTGERTELSGATLANWVAKTANLFVDGLGLGPGDPAVVLLPPHWQTAAVLLGAWSAGLVATREPGPGEVGFATPARAGELTQPERYLVGLHPLGLPLREVPPGYLDFTAEVRGYGDTFRPAAPAGQEELVGAAADRASSLGITPSDRILIDVDRYPDPLDWLLAPLSVAASTVLCGHFDPARLASRAEVERVTRTLAG